MTKKGWQAEKEIASAKTFSMKKACKLIGYSEVLFKCIEVMNRLFDLDPECEGPPKEIKLKNNNNNKECIKINGHTFLYLIPNLYLNIRVFQ